MFDTLGMAAGRAKAVYAGVLSCWRTGAVRGACNALEAEMGISTDPEQKGQH